MRSLLSLLLVVGCSTVGAAQALADPPPRPAPPPRPGFTTGPTPGFTTGRMPGFTTGPISDPRAGYPACAVDSPCVLIVDEDERFGDERPVDDEVGTLPEDD